MATLLYVPRFDENGASARYRVYQYLDGFKKLGFNITIKPLFDIKYLNDLYFKKKRSIIYLLRAYFLRAIYLFFNKNKFDLVLMDGELFPFVPFFIEKFFLPKLFIMDQDDAIFHTYDANKFFLVRFLLGKKIDKIMNKGQHIIVSNQYTKTHALKSGAKAVTALPTVVDANKYQPLPIKRSSTSHVTIGWVGSPSTVFSLKMIEQSIFNISRKKNIVLSVIGAQYHLDGVKTICIDWKNGWSESEEINLTNKIDIGIMPLKDGPYEKGKAGFKLIKYMACGKPIIASPVGMNLEIVQHNLNGYLASSPEEWEKYLLKLIENQTLREKLGTFGREIMLEKYSLQATKPIMNQILMHTYQQLKNG